MDAACEPVKKQTFEEWEAEVREVFGPMVEAMKEHEATDPGVSDQPCACCGLTAYCERGENGKVYCYICLDRGHGDLEVTA